MRVFIDTSAFAKRFVEEPVSEKVDSIISERADELGLSIICIPEIISAMNRRLREKSIAKQQYSKIKKRLSDELNDIDIIELNNVVIENTIKFLEKNAMRAMDAIHIASAFEWDADLFLTSDKKQFKAAKTVLKKVIFI